VAGLAAQLGVDVSAMAEGIVKLAVVKMTGAIKEISIMRGHDPRAFTLFAYGGAGPLHAAAIAAELGMPRVVVPPMPGNFSAFGLLVADVRIDAVKTRLVRTADLTFAELGEILGELRDDTRARLAVAGFSNAAMRFEASLDMRYVGQAFELDVAVDDTCTCMAHVERAFRTAHEARYSHATDDPVEIVTFRVAAYGLVAKPALRRATDVVTATDKAIIEDRAVVFDAAPVTTRVYARDLLPSGMPVAGPALIEESGTTTVVPPTFTAAADVHGNLVLERR
jgi:N-methylhydantoinase A